jgi:hypothetical protein
MRRIVSVKSKVSAEGSSIWRAGRWRECSLQQARSGDRRHWNWQECAWILAQICEHEAGRHACIGHSQFVQPAVRDRNYPWIAHVAGQYRAKGLQQRSDNSDRREMHFANSVVTGIGNQQVLAGSHSDSEVINQCLCR